LGGPLDDPRSDEARALLAHYGFTGVMTRRQEQVALLLARGWTTAQVAAELGIAPGTVHAHVARARLNARLHELRQARRRR
jgi:DNA-binding NarL/FixJ family response regulator